MKSPGRTNPATPRTSSTRTVTARLPSSSSEESVPRWPGPVIFELRTGSLRLNGERTIRQRTGRPWDFSDVLCVHGRSELQWLRRHHDRADVLTGCRRHDRVTLEPLTRHECCNAAN